MKVIFLDVDGVLNAPLENEGHNKGAIDGVRILPLKKFEKPRPLGR